MEDNAKVLKPVGEALHVYFDSIVKEPLPKRWIDLINWLNDQECEQEDRPGDGRGLPSYVGRAPSRSVSGARIVHFNPSGKKSR